MNSRNWNILCWNVRGLNDRDKWDPIRHKLHESDASIFCLQETKKESIDMQFIRKFSPRKYDKFDFVLQWEPLGEFWFVGPLPSFMLIRLKSILLQSE